MFYQIKLSKNNEVGPTSLFIGKYFMLLEFRALQTKMTSTCTENLGGKK
jgi:hypothetical protein